jgi:HEPN domain-containing protein/predicted nucleotidyltransferase
MLTTLDAIVQRLIDAYDPERIILFGSHASGTEEAGSDIDLLIVKETDRRPIDRRVEVERLLADRQIPLDLMVYTPREMLDLYRAGSPFIEAVVETGRVLYMRRATEAWLQEAREELETASILFEHRKYRGACFHSQQCVEKGLKALILEKGKRAARSHDIVELLNVVTADGWAVGLSMDEAIFLNSIYRGRYPTEEGLLPHGEPTEEDARRALMAAETVIDYFRAELGGSPGAGA